jgi:hypothetical protein
MTAVKAIPPRLEKRSIDIYTAGEATCDMKTAIRRCDDP